MAKLPIVGGMYKMQSRRFDVQRAVNFYAIASEVGTSKEPTALRSVPGLVDFAEFEDSPYRGMIATDQGRAFAVFGDSFYEIATSGTVTEIGTLNTATGFVGIEENGFQIIVVDGVEGWIFTIATDTWEQITDVAFPPCRTVTFQDGYFVVPKVNTNEYYISGINDGLSWDALDFGTAESSPDNLVTVISDNGNLWLFGDRTTEVHANTGDAVFPFSRISGAVTEVGCAAAFTVQTFNNTLAWLGVDRQGRGVVWQANGLTAQRISTQAIEALIATVPNLSGAYAYVYHEEGHVFYCLQIPGISTTLCYDAAVNLWHERASIDSETGELTQHRGAGQMFFAQKNLIADREDGKIYHQSLAFYDFAGAPIKRQRTFPHIADEKRLVTHASLELDMETGIGNASGQGSDPQIVLRYSDDGGFTWSNEIWRSFGALGDYMKRVVWRKLGASRDRVYEITITDPVFVQINGAYLNAT